MKKLRIGFIGCGNFALKAHVPEIQKNAKYEICAAMDINESACMDFKNKTGAAYCTTDIDKILSDEKLDVVFITTRHDSHAALTVKAANAGKHILCEKPMGMNADECRAVAEAVKKNNVKYTVGYNRGLSPMILKAKELLDCEKSKKMIYHRIQSHFPEDSWTHIPEIGGGRFVGEGCHIFDLLCELAGSLPVSVYASGSTFLDPDIVKIPDSAIVTITFKDGSVGTTLISSAGCADFPKEATEIYCNKKMIYINNFSSMEYYGFEGQKRISIGYDKMDKGHANEIDQLADAIINDTDSPNGPYKAARAAIISYKVNASVKSGSVIPVNESEYLF